MTCKSYWNRVKNKQNNSAKLQMKSRKILNQINRWFGKSKSAVLNKSTKFFKLLKPDIDQKQSFSNHSWIALRGLLAPCTNLCKVLLPVNTTDSSLTYFPCTEKVHNFAKMKSNEAIAQRSANSAACLSTLREMMSLQRQIVLTGACYITYSMSTSYTSTNSTWEKKCSLQVFNCPGRAVPWPMWW